MNFSSEQYEIIGKIIVEFSRQSLNFLSLSLVIRSNRHWRDLIFIINIYDFFRYHCSKNICGCAAYRAPAEASGGRFKGKERQRRSKGFRSAAEKVARGSETVSSAMPTATERSDGASTPLMPLLVSTIEKCNRGAKRQKSTQIGSESEYTEKRFSGYFQYAGVYFVYCIVEIAVNSGFCFQKSILKIMCLTCSILTL